VKITPEFFLRIRASADRLTGEFGRGFANPKFVRLFYLQSECRIGQSMTDQFKSPPIGQTVSGQLGIFQALTGEWAAIRAAVIARRTHNHTLLDDVFRGAWR
jgi:hypothetical protein